MKFHNYTHVKIFDISIKYLCGHWYVNCLMPIYNPTHLQLIRCPAALQPITQPYPHKGPHGPSPQFCVHLFLMTLFLLHRIRLLLPWKPDLFIIHGWAVTLLPTVTCFGLLALWTAHHSCDTYMQAVLKSSTSLKLESWNQHERISGAALLEPELINK